LGVGVWWGGRRPATCAFSDTCRALQNFTLAALDRRKQRQVCPSSGIKLQLPQFLTRANQSFFGHYFSALSKQQFQVPFNAVLLLFTNPNKIDKHFELYFVSVEAGDLNFKITG